VIPTADRITLSELREHFFAVSEWPGHARSTRRQRLEVAVSLALIERAEAAQYRPLTDAEWAALNTPMSESDDRLPY
jgi:hypothetical protein